MGKIPCSNKKEIRKIKTVKCMFYIIKPKIIITSLKFD